MILNIIKYLKTNLDSKRILVYNNYMKYKCGEEIESSLKNIVFYDLLSKRIMCLTEISGEFWICFKHPDGQFVTERKACFDDIEKLI